MAKENIRERILEHVADILKEEREAKGLSMTALAAKAGLSQPMVGFIEQRRRTPTLDTLLRISEVLEIDLAKVIQRAQRRAQSN